MGEIGYGGEGCGTGGERSDIERGITGSEFEERDGMDS